MITIGSLFSGVGALEMGLEWAGLGPVRWQVESNEFCQKVLTKHWPDIARHRDIRTVREGDLEPVGLVCAGLPCQPHSKAGQRRGRQDDRWLWPEFARIVGLVRPRFIVLENVPGLLTSDQGRAFGDVLGGLAALGYDAWWDCLRASDVGAPHQRERVFVVAWLPVAHAARIGQGEQPAAVPTGRNEPECSGIPLADTDRAREQQPKGSVCIKRGRAAHRRARATESEVVRDAHGPSERLDTYWPAGRGQAPFLYEPPRTSPNVANRTQRLRAIGNAVAPQVSYVIGHVVRALVESGHA